MDFLGIGPLELLLIFLIALVLLGPNDMVKAGRTLGRMLRKVVTSSTWQELRKIRYLPNKLMREAGIEENEWNIPSELQKVSRDISPWLTPPTIIDSPPSPKPKETQANELAAWTVTAPATRESEQARSIDPHSPQPPQVDSKP